VVADPGFHRRSGPQRLMNAAKVVVHVMQAHGAGVIFNQPIASVD